MGYRFSGQRTFKSLGQVFGTTFTSSILVLLVASVVFAAETKSRSAKSGAAVDLACVSKHLASLGLDDADPTDLAAFLSGTPILEDGVAPWSSLPVRNQRFAEICWSYSLNEFVDGNAKQVAGNNAITSADHNGFWHLYSEFFNHKAYFDQLRKKVAKGKISKRKAIEQVNLMLRLRKGSTLRKKFGYVMDPPKVEKASKSKGAASKGPPEVIVGSNESTALMEAPWVGFVPDKNFDHAIKTEKQGNDFQTALNKLIGTFLSDKSKLSEYTTTAADGINDDLYDLMVQNLKSFYGGSSDHPPYRPNDTFTVGGKSYTPLTYMKEVLNFDPTDYVEVTMTEKNQDAWLAAVNHTMTQKGAKNPKAVPIGIPVYNQPLAEKQGVFSLNTLQKQAIGGHEILMINLMGDSNGDPNSAISRNSWGEHTGLTIDGKDPKKGSPGGDYGITYPYLIAVTKLGEPPSIMIPKALLSLPQFSALKK